jgi:Ca2+-binding RTX toxin-like protein
MTPVDVRKDGTANDGGMGELDNVGLDVERISGGLASDTLRGGPGTGMLEGAPGDDNLNGGPGPDHLLGGPGQDTIMYSTEPDVAVRLDASTASTSLPNDQDRIEEIENVRGGNRHDTVTGSDEVNVLTGAARDDYLDGLRGVDRLDGGPGADVVVARDRARDGQVSCGPGKDMAIVDRRDRVVRRDTKRCEQVDNGSQTSRDRLGLCPSAALRRGGRGVQPAGHASARAARLRRLATKRLPAALAAHPRRQWLPGPPNRDFRTAPERIGRRVGRRCYGRAELGAQGGHHGHGQTARLHTARADLRRCGRRTAAPPQHAPEAGPLACEGQAQHLGVRGNGLDHRGGLFEHDHDRPPGSGQRH